MPNVRRLAYRDRYVWELIQTIDGGSSSLPPLQFSPSVETPVLVSWTEEQWNRVFSALITGADLSYPEQSHQVVWDLLKYVEYPLPIAYPGDMAELTVFANNFNVVSGNPLTLSIQTGQIHNFVYFQNTPANGQGVQFHRVLSPGVWDYKITHIKNSVSGNVNLVIREADNNIVENVNLAFYNAVFSVNQFFTGSFTVSVDGIASFTMTTTSAGTGGGFRADWTVFEAWRTS